jgi:predicted Fe-Mo cluster-binding NifX family protein
MSTKVAISSEGPGLDDLLDSRFGRAAGFVLVDPETMESTYLDNASAQMRGQGAGIQAAEMVAGAGAKLVLTGYVGPKAFNALQAAGVQVGQDLQGLTVRQALERYKSGGVQTAQAPNSPGRR